MLGVGNYLVYFQIFVMSTWDILPHATAHTHTHQCQGKQLQSWFNHVGHQDIRKLKGAQNLLNILNQHLRLIRQFGICNIIFIHMLALGPHLNHWKPVCAGSRGTESSVNCVCLPPWTSLFPYWQSWRSIRPVNTEWIMCWKLKMSVVLWV